MSQLLHKQCAKHARLKIKVLRPTEHKISHFRDVPESKRQYGKTKPNTTKACIRQSKQMYYNTK